MSTNDMGFPIQVVPAKIQLDEALLSRLFDSMVAQGIADRQSPPDDRRNSPSIKVVVNGETTEWHLEEASQVNSTRRVGLSEAGNGRTASGGVTQRYMLVTDTSGTFEAVPYTATIAYDGSFDWWFQMYNIALAHLLRKQAEEM